MQLVLLALALGILAHDAGQLPTHDGILPAGWLALLVILPKLLLALVYWLACVHVYRRLDRGGVSRALRRLHLFTTALPLLAIASYGLDLWAGTLQAIRGQPGDGGLGPRDVVLLDELALMLPTLTLIVVGWWAYYPIDRRIREVSILRRADLGLPLYPLWSRSQYVVTQLRNQAGLILGPLLMLMAWSEALVMLRLAGRISETTQLWLTPLGAAAVFLAAPLLIRLLWDTVPLPPGPIRNKLEHLCHRHRVKVRRLLLWRTHGGVINAAVMGLFGRVRYVLLTDGLLDQVEEKRVEAVMAHELGHVRLRHLWWLLIAAAAIMIVLAVGGDLILHNAAWLPDGSEPLLMLGGFALWAVGFGWVSRRIERQADTFAARHMSEVVLESSIDETSEAAPRRFESQGVAAMIGALQRVADLNHVAVQRRSWRHGSIAKRQRNLRSLVGQRLDQADIDRTMRAINATSLLIVSVAVAWAVVMT